MGLTPGPSSLQKQRAHDLSYSHGGPSSLLFPKGWCWGWGEQPPSGSWEETKATLVHGRSCPIRVCQGTWRVSCASSFLAAWVPSVSSCTPVGGPGPTVLSSGCHGASLLSKLTGPVRRSPPAVSSWQPALHRAVTRCPRAPCSPRNGNRERGSTGGGGRRPGWRRHRLLPHPQGLLASAGPSLCGCGPVRRGGERRSPHSQPLAFPCASSHG